jgi:hypothetical protein
MINVLPQQSPGSGLGFVNAAALIALDSILVKPKRAFGDIKAQVTLEETHDDEMEITEHPVEQGAAISDHAYKRPARLRVHCAWSNSPSVQGLVDGAVGAVKSTISSVQSLITGNSEAQVKDFYEKLLKLQSDRIPFDVYTGKRRYTNMLVKSLNTTTSKDTENSLIVIAAFQQVIIVQTQTILANAPAANQADPAATQPVTNSGTKSLLPSAKFNNAGDGRGFVNPPLVGG